MKGTSKVIMGATLVMVVSLALVLGLILVLLAELYCSLLLRRRRRFPNTTSAAGTTTNRANASSPSQTFYPQDQSPPPTFSSIYAQGVLQAPRSFLFPAVASDDDMPEPKKQHSELRHFIQIQTQPSNTSPLHRTGLVSASSPPASFASKAPQKPLHEGAVQAQVSVNGTICDKSSCGGEHLVYISNPIFENEESNSSSSFKTPDTSPSRLERSGSSGDDDVAAPACHSPPCTPPLSPMKKLPAEACSVSLRDARSLGTSGSDSRSINALSSSSSGSPCTSPSW